MRCLRYLRLFLFAALLTSCSDSRSTLTVRLNALTDSDLGSVAVTVEHPDGRTDFNLDDFAPGPESTILGVGPFGVPDAGEISVVMTYTDPQGNTSKANATWALRTDFEWSLSVFGVEPDEQCMGCRAFWPFDAVATQGGAPRPLWLVLGGSEAGSGAVY